MSTLEKYLLSGKIMVWNLSYDFSHSWPMSLASIYYKNLFCIIAKVAGTKTSRCWCNHLFFSQCIMVFASMFGWELLKAWVSLAMKLDKSRVSYLLKMVFFGFVFFFSRIINSLVLLDISLWVVVVRENYLSVNNNKIYFRV